jgi:hypothetical protein
LAGFIDGSGSLRIVLLDRYNRKNPFEVRLQLHIELSHAYLYLLEAIQTHFGGNLSLRTHKSGLLLVSYNSTSFFVYLRLIHYLDNYHLCSNKYKEFVIWRRAYFYRTDFFKLTKMKDTLSHLKK